MAEAKRNIESVIPPTRSAVVTKSDSTVLEPTCSLWIGTAGDLVVEEVGAPGVARTYRNVPVGEFIGQFTKVMAATTCADIVARYN